MHLQREPADRALRERSGGGGHRAEGGRDYVVTLTAISSTAIAGQVRASRTMPAVLGTLAALVGYDTFACTATDLAPVDIMALAPVP